MKAALPEPDAHAREHCARVTAHLQSVITAAGGWLDFAAFMDEALYAPGLGYYSAGATKLGVAGDFITAPEAGALFARTLARGIAPALETLPAPGIIEFGAGTGAMAAAIVDELAALGQAPPDYALLEPSADLASRQRTRIGALPDALARRVRWLQRLPAPAPAGVVLANEVLDALPVRRFRVTAQRQVVPLGVVIDDGRFDCRAGPAEPAFTAEVRRRLGPVFDALPAGYESEFSVALPAWLTSVLALYDRGLVLLVDYGLPRSEYYDPGRDGGTLRCHYRHRAHSDPLILPGLQDITAWVDFTTVAEAAVDAGWEVAGFATQAHYLLDAGLLELLEQPASSRVAAELAGEVQLLTMPGGMGERFRVMALTRGLAQPPPGFGLRDLRDRL